MYQYNNNIGYMVQYDMHQNITISMIRYDITHLYVTVKCMHIYKQKQKKEIKVKITDQCYKHML